MRAPRHLGVALAVAVAALASLAPPLPAAQSCAAAGSPRAGIVVQHGNGSIVTRCVALAADTVTAEQALTSSGIAWSGQTFGGFGVAVCAVDGEPARYLECPGKDSYWAVFVSRGGAAWQLSPVGISALELRDGDLAGFRYVPAAGTPAAPASPVGVCAAAAPSAASVPAATPTRAATAGASAGATASASAAPASLSATTTATTSSPNAAAPPPSVPPSSPSGPDPGLLAAAAAGGALAGLAILRLAAARRAP